MSIRSKRSHEGYLLIDSRHAPSPAAGELPIVRHIFECGMLTCSHCQRQMQANPLRTRDRGYCQKCDHYLCDGCEALRSKTGECLPFVALLDRLQEAALKAESSEPRIYLPFSEPEAPSEG